MARLGASDDINDKFFKAYNISQGTMWYEQ